MKTSYFRFLLTVLIVGFAGLGYWSYQTIDISFDSETAPAVQSEILATETPVEVVTNQELGIEETITSKPAETPVTAAPVTEKKMPEKYVFLGKRLQNLVKDNISMKLGSKGTRVGTVQEFLNIYEGSKSALDNKYGSGMQSRIKKFQEASGISAADGFANPETYQKMIDWLKTQ
jgi:hypothetical protein